MVATTAYAAPDTESGEFLKAEQPVGALSSSELQVSFQQAGEQMFREAEAARIAAEQAEIARVAAEAEAARVAAEEAAAAEAARVAAEQLQTRPKPKRRQQPETRPRMRTPRSMRAPLTTQAPT